MEKHKKLAAEHILRYSGLVNIVTEGSVEKRTLEAVE